MAHHPIRLTKTDHEILASYINVLHGLAAYLGDGYEMVLHSLESFEHSVICILNGEHTGRKVGAPITDLALNMLDEISKGQKDTITYFSKNRKGEPLKSTTIAIRGENQRIIGLFCINFYMNTSFYDILQTMIPAEQIITAPKENFAENSDELIETTLESVKLEVYANQAISANNKNKYIVYQLEERGIFNIKDAVIKVAQSLGISKNTVYMHIRNKVKK